MTEHFHRLRKFKEYEQAENAPYKYICLDCGKKLKVMSGVLIEHQPEQPKENKYHRTTALAKIRDFIRETNCYEIPQEVCDSLNLLASYLTGQRYTDWAIPVLSSDMSSAEVERLMKSGLSREQAFKIEKITERMSKLNDEALEIVKPTPEEMSNSADCYADDKHSDLAELIAGSLGSWQDVLEDRIMLAEENAEDSGQ